MKMKNNSQEMTKNTVLMPKCRGVVNNDAEETVQQTTYNPYENAVYLEKEDGVMVPYLNVSERIVWFHRYCESKEMRGSIKTDLCPQLTGKGSYPGLSMVTMKAVVTLSDSVGVLSEYTGYGSCMVTAEGYSGNDIEAAETRAIGRALRNAGFISPSGESDERVPVDGAKPQNIPTPNATNILDTLNAMTEEHAPNVLNVANTATTVPVDTTIANAFANQPSTSAVNQETAEKTEAVEALDAKLYRFLQVKYPFKPWVGTPVYELLEQPLLKDKLTWLTTEYSGKEEIKQWAAFLLQYVFGTTNAEKQIYLAARTRLREASLIK